VAALSCQIRILCGYFSYGGEGGIRTHGRD
jgi:hypothetical protein